MKKQEFSAPAFVVFDGDGIEQFCVVFFMGGNDDNGGVESYAGNGAAIYY